MNRYTLWAILLAASFTFVVGTEAILDAQTITTIAGGGLPNNVPATSIPFNPGYIAVDGSGNVFIAAISLNVVYKITPNGISTIFAGTGAAGFSGDNGPATSAQLNSPGGLGVDNAGNLFIADFYNFRVRKVTPTGTITTVAGNGSYGYSGDNGPATSAQITYVYSIAADTSGNLYIADGSNFRIRKVSGGVITTVAGDGVQGFSGDNGPATSAQINYVNGLAADALGNLYIADTNNYRVRKVSGGVITTVAGNGAGGFFGDNGPATSAQISFVDGVATDASGNVYIADTGSERIRKVSGGVITTVAGTGSYGFSGDNGPATSATLAAPNGVAADLSGNLYISDSSNYRIRKVILGTITTIAGNGSVAFSGDNGVASNAQFSSLGIAVQGVGNFYIADAQDYRIRNVNGGLITTAAGTGVQGYSGDNVAATSSQLSYSPGVAVDPSGNLYIADQSNQRIRKVSGGVITTIAGNGGYGYSGDNGPATSAQLSNPSAVAVDNAGNVYIADSSNNRVRKVSGGVITTVAGGGPTSGVPATSVSLSQIVAVASDASGNLYVPDKSAHRVYMISTSGTITTVVGTGIPGFSGDSGLATSAQLNSPSGVAVNSTGSVIYIADSNNSRVRKVSGGVITTVAGNGSFSFSGDGGLAINAALSYPSSVALDSAGNLFVTDTYNYRIREVALNGIITTIAGNGTCCFSGDGGAATSAQINYATAIAAGGGNLYIGDSENYRVRQVSAGIITTVAGTGVYGYSGDGAAATNAQLSNVYGLALDSSGNLFIADAANSRIRKVSGGVITTVAGTGVCGFSGDSGAATSAQICNPYYVALDGTGTLYIADTSNYRVRKVTSGTITTVAGNGSISFSGDLGQATAAQLSNPSSLAIDGAGNLYIADAGNCRIREVSSVGVISTVAGNGICGFNGDSYATSVEIGYNPALATDSVGNLYLAEPFNQRVREVSKSGLMMIFTIAGSGGTGFSGDGGLGTSATLSNPNGVAVDSAGNVYISDSGNSRIRLLTPSPPPVIISTSPTSALSAISPGFTLTVNGSNFASGNVVQWNGTALSTTFVNSSQLTATVTASLIALPGTAYITVNGISNPVAFTILPEALVTSLTPSSVNAGQTFTLTISGSNFLSGPSGSVPYWNNTPNLGVLPNASFVDSSHLTATVPASYISGAGGYNVVVQTPNPTLQGNVFSNTATLSVVGCTYSLGNNSNTIPSAAYSGSVGLTANCPYAATSDNPSFITITSGAAGGGSSNIGYSVAANNTGSQRTGTLTVTDQNGFSAALFTITQQAAPCSSLTASPSSFSFGSGAASSSIALSASCPWTGAFSSNTAVVTLPASSGSSTSIPFNVSANMGGTSRTATITFNNPSNNNSPVSVSVVQNALVCTYTISDSNSGTSHGFLNSGGVGTINVTAPTGCLWTPSANGSFLSITSPGSQTGTGTVGYAVSANTTTQSLSGSINVAGLAYTITEAATPVFYICTTAAGVPPLMRAEGVTELSGDIVLSCTGEAAPGGVAGDVVVYYNANITNLLLTGSSTDALLLLDEPSPQNLALNTNAFRGVINPPGNYLLFPGVPLAPASGGAFSRTLRITNVRLNANSLAGSANAQVMLPVPFNLANPLVAVGFASAGLPGANTLKPAGFQNSATLPVSFTEGFASAFHPRLAGGQDPSTTGLLYNSESGFVNSAVLGSQTGFATAGTRLIAQFVNIPVGVTLSAATTPVSGNNATLVSANANGIGGYPITGSSVPLPAINGVATATWEVTASNPTMIESFTFNVSVVSNPNGANLSGIQYQISLAPPISVASPSLSAPIPRFAASLATAPPVIQLSLAPQSASNIAFGGGVSSLGARLASRAMKSTTVGGTVTISELLTNNDPNNNTATNVTVGGTLPPSWTVVNGSCISPGGTCTANGSQLSVAYPYLTPGQTGSLTLLAQTDVEGLTSLTYNSIVSSDLAVVGGNASFTVNVPVPSLVITSTHQGAFIRGQMQAGTYSLIVTNNGATPTDGSMIEVDDFIQPGMSIYSISGGQGSGWNCAAYYCMRNDVLGPGLSYPPITVVVNVASNAAASVVNEVCVGGGGSTLSCVEDPTNVTFATAPPASPLLVYPGAGATGVPTNACLSWNSSSASSYNVYFGTTSTLTTPVVTIPGVTYCPMMAPGTTYYWTVTATNSGGSSALGTPQSYTTSLSGFLFVPITPCRVADTRQTNGPFGGPFITAGTSRSFTIPNSACGIPTTAQAFSLNVAVVPHSGLGFLTVWPTGQAQPQVATLNSLDGRIKSNATILAAGTGGSISVFATNDTDIILDINGYFVPPSTPGSLAFYPIAPCRLVDTRNGTLLSGSFTAGQTRTLPILSSTCAVPPSAQAYSLNFVAVPPARVGFLTAYPSGVARPAAATLNDVTGTVAANAAVVPAGTGGSIDVFASDATQLVVDINGYYAPPSTGGLSLHNLTPCRVLDTRLPSGSPPITGQHDVNVLASGCGGTPATQAYVFNATVVPTASLGYLTMWPQGTSRPGVATLNALDGAITNNLAVVPTNNTQISAFASDSTHLILDLFGYFAP